MGPPHANTLAYLLIARGTRGPGSKCLGGEGPTYDTQQPLSPSLGAPLSGLRQFTGPPPRNTLDPGNTTHDLPMVAGGAGLSSLSRMASASYLGAFFRVAGPFLDRLAHMGGNTTARVAALLADPPAAKMDQSRATSVHAHTRRPSSCKPRSPPRTSTPSTSSPQEATSSCVRAILGH